LDHFTHFIIRQELMAITSLPMPDPSKWAFCELNDLVFDAHNLPMNKDAVEKVTPDEWVRRGSPEIMTALFRAMVSAQEESC
jgi:putative membrane protein